MLEQLEILCVLNALLVLLSTKELVSFVIVLLTAKLVEELLMFVWSATLVSQLLMEYVLIVVLLIARNVLEIIHANHAILDFLLFPLPMNVFLVTFKIVKFVVELILAKIA